MSKTFYVLSALLSKQGVGNTTTSGMCGWRICDNEDEARGSFFAAAQREKPGFAVVDITCTPVPENDLRFALGLEEIAEKVEATEEPTSQDDPSIPQPDFRNLVYRFCNLYLSQTRQLAKRFELTDPTDAPNAPSTERIKTWLTRAKEKGILRELDAAIQEMEKDNE